MASQRFKLGINAIKADMEGGLPYILLQYPAGAVTPELKEALRLKEVMGMPSATLNSPWNGAAVKKFRQVSDAMAAGKRFTIDIEFDPEAVKLSGIKSPTVSLNATRVFLDSVEERQSIFSGGSADEADETAAKAMNKAVTEASRARFAAMRTRVSPSGTVTPAEAAETELPDTAF